MYVKIKEINQRPAPFEFYTADALWVNDHTSKQMLKYHLNETVDMSSRNKVFIENSVKWIANHFDLNEQKAIADFGCGPGLYTSRFAERKVKVTGIDFSENSINYAKQYANQNDLQINYVRENYLNFQTTEEFDLVTMIMCDFCALSPAQRQIMLAKFHSLLKPNGSLLLDAYSLAGFHQREESSTYEHNQLNGFWSSEDYYCFVNTFKYESEKVVLDKYTIIKKLQNHTVYNWLQYFSIDMIKNEFLENGFTIVELFSDVTGKSYSADSTEFAVVARKV